MEWRQLQLIPWSLICPTMIHVWVNRGVSHLCLQLKESHHLILHLETAMYPWILWEHQLVQWKQRLIIMLQIPYITTWLSSITPTQLNEGIADLQVLVWLPKDTVKVPVWISCPILPMQQNPATKPHVNPRVAPSEKMNLRQQRLYPLVRGNRSLSRTITLAVTISLQVRALIFYFPHSLDRDRVNWEPLKLRCPFSPVPNWYTRVESYSLLSRPRTDASLHKTLPCRESFSISWMPYSCSVYWQSCPGSYGQSEHDLRCQVQRAKWLHQPL